MDDVISQRSKSTLVQKRGSPSEECETCQTTALEKTIIRLSDTLEFQTKVMYQQ